MPEPLPNRRQIERMLAERGLSVVFQPIYELETQRLISLEALARFRHPEGFDTAAWFAGAHACGLGTELELTALAAALESLDAFPEDVSLAVNVSPSVAVLEALYESVRPYAGRVVVEVTENHVTRDYATLALALARVRAAGATVAVDDVGAGYSTIRHVLCVAPDVVKLDLTLTRAAGLTREGRTQALSFISAAREVDAVVAAEGIENRTELATMRELGVDHVQGYYLCEPAPLAAVLDSHYSFN